MTVQLPNPVPYEAVQQLARHLKRINKGLGFYNTFTNADVSNQPRSMENANISQDHPAFINISWDIDECLDVQPQGRTNGLANYRSTCFLNCYLFSNQNPHLVRTQLHADLHRYFFNKQGDPGYVKGIGDQNWTLYTENNQKVVHELYITRLNTNLTFEKKPIIQVDFELTLFWATLNSNLNYPR